MSQRHRTTEVTLPPKPELRAQAHRERHRIREELSNVASQVSAGLDPDDLHEPGAAWKPAHHHDPDVAKDKRAAEEKFKEINSPAGHRRHQADQAAGQGQGLRAQAEHAPLEDEDVEAPLGAAPGEGPGDAPHRRELVL